MMITNNTVKKDFSINIKSLSQNNYFSILNEGELFSLHKKSEGFIGVFVMNNYDDRIVIGHFSKYRKKIESDFLEVGKISGFDNILIINKDEQKEFDYYDIQPRTLLLVNTDIYKVESEKTIMGESYIFIPESLKNICVGHRSKNISIVFIIDRYNYSLFSVADFVYRERNINTGYGRLHNIKETIL